MCLIKITPPWQPKPFLGPHLVSRADGGEVGLVLSELGCGLQRFSYLVCVRSCLLLPADHSFSCPSYPRTSVEEKSSWLINLSVLPLSHVSPTWDLGISVLKTSNIFAVCVHRARS